MKQYASSDPERLAQQKNAPIRPAVVKPAESPLEEPIIPGWALTISERKRILLNHLHGVDIDAQAVEVTKLNLLLKCLEGETSETLGFQTRLFRERALPDLGKNILCGNSLIGTDIIGTEAWEEMTLEERDRMNPFDYEGAFPQVFKAKDRGFDAVIGNPPWGSELGTHDLEYVRERHREIIVRMIDSFMFFINRATSLANRTGFIGMIIPDVLLYQIDNTRLRDRLLDATQLCELLNLGDVFDQVTRPAAIVITQNHGPSVAPVRVVSVVDLDEPGKKQALSDGRAFVTAPIDLYRNLPGRIFVTDRIRHYAIYTKIAGIHTDSLSNLLAADGMQRGVSPDFKDAFIMNRGDADRASLETEVLRDVVTGGHHVKRYSVSYPDLVLIYTKRDDDFSKLPNVCRYIDRFKEQITCKEVKLGKHPLYALHRPREPTIFTKPIKLMGVITSDRLIIAPDSKQTFATDGVFVVSTADVGLTNVVLAILNSKLATFLYRLISFEFGRVLAQVKPAIVQQLPVPSNEQLTGCGRLNSLVDSMLALHKRLSTEQLPQRREQIQREIDATDRQIDALVYQLYGLTDDEIAIVEEATR